MNDFSYKWRYSSINNSACWYFNFLGIFKWITLKHRHMALKYHFYFTIILEPILFAALGMTNLNPNSSELPLQSKRSLAWLECQLNSEAVSLFQNTGLTNLFCLSLICLFILQPYSLPLCKFVVCNKALTAWILS